MPVTLPNYEVFKDKTSVFRDRFHLDYGKKWKAVHLAYQAYVATPTDINGQPFSTAYTLTLKSMGRALEILMTTKEIRINFLKTSMTICVWSIKIYWAMKRFQI